MTDESAFLQAIHDSPDDLALRLVFADWLEENGDPGRAADVRVEVKLAQLFDGESEGALLRAYSEYLYVAHSDRLGTAIDARYGKAATRSGFGVPDCVHIENPKVAAGDEAALAPPLRRLTVVQRGQGTALLSRPELAGVSALEVHGIEPAEFDALLARPLPRLRELNLTYPRLDPVRAGRLFDAPVMQQLTGLALSGPGSIAGLFTCPRPKSLRQLHLSYVTLDAAATEALFGGWAGLDRLDLKRVTVDEATAARMLGGDGLSTLEGLRLSECDGVGHRAIAALMSNGTLERLRMLLYTPPRGTAPLPADVLAATGLPALEYLDLWQTRLGEAGGAAIARSAVAPRLRGLKLNRCGVGRDDAAAMFVGDFRNLEHLELEGVRITGGSRGALLSAAWLPRLKSLRLDWCPLKPADGRALARCAALSGLRFLDLSNCQGLGDDGLLPIILSPHLARLEVLHADGTNATAAIARALHGAPMRAALRLLRLDLEPLRTAFGLGESARQETFRSIYWDRGMPE
jgi:uncharacterized protein (TIGR02996 family)